MQYFALHPLREMPTRKSHRLRPQALIVSAVVVGPLRHNLVRTALSVCAITLGTALGIAVQLINTSAVAEFTRTARMLSGSADVIVRGAPFDEDLYSRIARMREVAVASPMIELDVKLAAHRDFVRVVGIDPFQSSALQPLLGEGEHERNLLEPDTVVISDDIRERLDISVGEQLVLQAASHAVSFSVIGILPPGSATSLVLLDIANVQWRLHMLGKINRIDIKLHEGVNPGQFRRCLNLPAGIYSALPDEDSGRASEVSRAYRVNLNMLSLVALFTGSFIVFSTQALSVIQRRRQFAVMRALGLSARSLTSLVLLEAFSIGIIGAAIGACLGIFVAHAALQTAGADLGAGYFKGMVSSIEIEPATLVLFFVLGVVAAAAGAFFPSLTANRISAAQALKAVDASEARRIPAVPMGALVLMCGIVAAFAPPVFALPLFGYAAIAFILIGAGLLTPALIERMLARLPRPRGAFATLALASLKANPRQTALSVFGIIAAFSVMAAMAIMIASFRESLSEWLTEVLPADVYVRARGDTAFLSEAQQDTLVKLDGVAKARFVRYYELLLEDGLRLTLIARENPNELPAIGTQVTPPSDVPGAWVSQAASDLHGFRRGETIWLPIAGSQAPFLIAGIWRDYARQTGAVAIERDLYVKLSGDKRANDAALWLEHGAEPEAVSLAIREALGDDLDVAASGELHLRSLQAFDRTFAVTYFLEAVAVLVGLLGVSAGFSARVLDRRSEFAVLRHLGAARRDILTMLACEGALSSTAGTVIGLVLGTALSVILIFVVNRQSFHWSMDMHFPWLAIAALSLMMVAAATAVAVFSARKAAGAEMIQAVREDW